MKTTAVPAASAILEWCAALPWWGAAEEIAGVLRTVGCPHSFIGGVVRDAVRSLVCGASTVDAGDLDLVIERDAFTAVSDVVVRSRRFAGAVVRRHPAFLTMSITLPSGVRFDLARARTERYAGPGSLPTVRPGTVADDIRRRDFTINAVCIRWDSAARVYRVLDPSDGIGDIRRRVLRVFHPASFRDDPTRILRAVRFASTLGYTVERRTLGLLRAAVSAGSMRTVSPARCIHEFLTLLRKGRNLDVAAALMVRWGVAACFEQADPVVALYLRHARAIEFAAAAPAERYPCRLMALAALLAAEAGCSHTVAVRRLLTWCGIPRADRAGLFAAARLLDGDAAVEPPAWFARYCTVWNVRPVRPIIDGRAVLEMGCPPGPRVGIILRDVRRRQKQGLLRTAQQARRFVARMLRTDKK